MVRYTVLIVTVPLACLAIMLAFHTPSRFHALNDPLPKGAHDRINARPGAVGVNALGDPLPEGAHDRINVRPGLVGAEALDDPLPEGAIARLGTTRMRHSHPPGRYCWGIGSIAWSPDGKTIATTTCQDTTGVEARIWEASTGKARSPLENNLRYGPTFVRFSPDSKTLAAAAGDRIVLWDVATGKEVGQLAGHQSAVDSLVFCDGGKTLVSVSQDGAVHWWDVAGRKSVRSWLLPANEPRKNDRGEPIRTGIRKTRFSADGNTLAVAQWWTTEPKRSLGENRALLYDLKIRKEIWREDCDAFFNFAFAPDGKRLAKSRSGAVWLLETATGRQLDRSDWQYHPDGLDFSPDGKTLALVMNGTVGFWSPDDKTPVRKYDSPLHGGGYNTFSASPVFSPDGKQLAIDRRLKFEILDVATGEPALSYPSYDEGLDPLAFSSDGRTLFASDGDILVDTATWRQRAKPKEAPLPGNSYERSRSTDGTLCVADGGDFRDTLFDLKTGRAIVHFEVPDRQPAGCEGLFSPLCSVYVMRDFQCDGKETVRLFAIPSGKRLCKLNFNQFIPNCWSFSADEARVAFFERGAGIHVHDTATGKLLWKTGVDTASAKLALSPSGDLLAAWSSDLRNVHIWNLAAKDQAVQILQRKAVSAAECLAWSPDNRLLAVGSDDNSVLVWEIASGQVRREFLGHLAEPTCLAFSADGQVLVSGSKDTTMLVWKMLSDKKRHDSLTEDELAARWESLAAEAGTAYEALADLLHAPKSAVEFLARRLQPAPAFDTRQVAAWIKDLDHDTFAVRDQATRELASLGDLIRAPLRQALAANPPLETRLRLQDLLDKMNQLQPAQLRCLRAIEVLERIGTPQAVEILERLTQGNPENRVTAESRTVLARIKQQK